ncbi:MAG TPA: DUF1365 domain-containing protein, partial [Parvularculaceae bacterium]|nr:DUF1365 domain-containing protein [Parvularculaceae bacterium]
GKVTHQRLRPVGHRFSYRVFSMLIDIDRLDAVSKRLKFFSHNRFNLFSAFDRDHAGDDDAPLPARIRAVLWGAGYRGDGRIELLCYPRILGYVFNPLCVYYCRDAEDRLEAVLYEVRNTFGGMHSYLIGVEEEGARIRHSADKAFHVSPFMDMDQRYHFTLTPPGDELSVFIRQTDADGPIFVAGLSGVREAMTDKALLAAFFRYPLMTIKVIAAIHWEALRLLAKGLRLKPGAKDPERPVSIVAAREARSKAA